MQDRRIDRYLGGGGVYVTSGSGGQGDSSGSLFLTFGRVKSEIPINRSPNMSIARRCITARHVMQDRATAWNFGLDPTIVKL